LANNFGNLSSKINLYVALAPVVQMNNIQDSFFLSLSKSVGMIQWWLNFFGIYEMFGTDWQIISSGFCFFNQNICNNGVIR
jgi:hypothetical protein